MKDAAQRYLAAGLCVLPARRDQKRPTVAWKPFQKRLPTEREVDVWFSNGQTALCVLTGAVSGNLELMDFDQHGALFDAWCEKVRSAKPGLLERLVISLTQNGGRHASYRYDGEICGNLKLAQRRGDGGRPVTLIETRGEGGLFLCAPTAGYEVTQGDLCAPPVLIADERDILLGCAWELNEHLPPVVDGPAGSPVGATPAARAQHGPTSGHTGPTVGLRPGDDFSRRGDLRAVLEQHGWRRTKAGDNEYWCRPGKTSGASATLKDRVFYVFSSNAAPFEPNKGYSSFAVYTLLEHGGDYEQAARALRRDGYGGDGPGTDVDISAIVGRDGPDDDAVEPADEANPGPVPDDLLYMPGFIGELIDFCLAGAPYPSRGMAFCGALTMLGHLTGRKVRDPSDLRTNLYVLALASSSAGKNYPRQVNSHLAMVANMAETIRIRFASGEGIEDRLEAYPSTMYQTDEIDGLLQSVSKSKDARFESIMSTLLTVFSSANMMYPMRSKAGKQSAGVIHQPHLTIFGTATPGHYYEALSERMLTNGFFARMIIVDTGKRAAGQDALPVYDMPQRLIETACWWAEFQPGERRGNLFDYCPQPIVVPYTDDGKGAADEFRRYADQQYSQAEDRSDEVAMTVWGRANENARKLALLYACSESYEQPEIGLAAVEWATAFIEHQTRRMLFMAAQYVSSNDFDALCKRAIRVLREWHAREGREALIPQWKFRRQLKLHPAAFKDVMFELDQRRQAMLDTQPGKTKPRQGYRLL